MTDEELKEIIRQAAVKDVDDGQLTYGEFPTVPNQDHDRFYELLDQATITVSVTWDGGSSYDDGYQQAMRDLAEDSNDWMKAYEDLQKKFNTVYENYQELQGRYLKAVGDLDELTAQIDHLKRANDGLAARLLERPSIKPEDMQDGKRYRAIFEGTSRDLSEFTSPELHDDDGEIMDRFLLQEATRIEEIS